VSYSTSARHFTTRRTIAGIKTTDHPTIVIIVPDLMQLIILHSRQQLPAIATSKYIRWSYCHALASFLLQLLPIPPTFFTE
jgi:hypothetical protein